MPSVAKHLYYNQTFLTKNYLFEMIRKIIFTNYFFLNLYTKSPYNSVFERPRRRMGFDPTLCHNAAPDKILKTPYEFYDVYILV